MADRDADLEVGATGRRTIANTACRQIFLENCYRDLMPDRDADLEVGATGRRYSIYRRNFPGSPFGIAPGIPPILPIGPLAIWCMNFRMSLKFLINRLI